MCSRPRRATAAQPTTQQLSPPFGATIDAYTAAVGNLERDPNQDAVSRVAAAWAMLAYADPDLAARIAAYIDS